MSFDDILAWFFPTPCVACGAPPLPLCSVCELSLVAAPSWSASGSSEYSSGPIAPGKAPRPDLRLCLGPYSGPLASLVRVSKEGHQPRFSRLLADRAAKLLSSDLVRSLGLQGVCAPPTRPASGPFHPAKVLAERVSAWTGLRLLEGLVTRREAAARTRDLGIEARARHVEATLLGGPPPPPGIRRIALVDDLVTTGATLRRMRRLLALRSIQVPLILTLAFTPRVKSRN